MRLEDLAEEWDDSVFPSTEQNPITDNQRQWAENGFVIKKNLIPEDLMAAYEKEWLGRNGGPGSRLGDPSTYETPMGWQHATPYMDNDALRALACCKQIAEIGEELISEPIGLHLNLTGWKSTRRNWHFDQYLNESYVGGFYVAVWIALDTINPDAGPFEYVPGSHKWWPPISQSKMRQALGRDGQGPAWPTHSERILTPIFEEELSRVGGAVPFLGERGDVLFWHSRLLHRGSTPNNPDLERRSLISHYSGVNHRPDMPQAVKHAGGGWFFPLNGRTPTNYKSMR